MPGLVKGGADDHALLRLVREADAAVDGRTILEILHVEVQHPVCPLVAEGQVIALAGDGHISGSRGFRQTGLAQRKDAHGAFGHLPPLLQLQERDGIQPHVAVVVDGQGHSKAAIINKVVIPLLDVDGAGLNVPAAVDGQELFAVTGLTQVAVFVQQRLGGSDFMLHNGSPFCFLVV